MKNENFLIVMILVLAATFTFSACQKSEVKADLASQENSYTNVREIDFKNFTYPDETGRGRFTLEDGDKLPVKKEEFTFGLENVEYADLTNDGQDEAIIKILVEYGGASSGLIYVYTLEKQKPKRLWYAASGHDAKGGLKEVRAENGDLTVELFGKNEYVESKDGFKPAENADAPKDSYGSNTFTKFRFKWNGEKFALAGEPEQLDYDLKKQLKEFEESVNKQAKK